MDGNLKDLQKIAKHAVAGTIFVSLLLGASAAVFSAAAAGVTALSSTSSSSSSFYQSNAPRSSTTSNVRSSAQTSASSNPPQSVPGNPNGNPVGLSGQIGTTSQSSDIGLPSTRQVMTVGDFTDRLNNELVHSHSPVSEALDSGGVLLGNKVSHTFGHFLSNLLQFLFVEQSDSSTPASVSQSGNPGTSYGSANGQSTGSGAGASNGY